MKWTHKEGFRKPADVTKYLNGFALGKIGVVAVNSWRGRDQVLFVGYEPSAPKEVVVEVEPSLPLDSSEEAEEDEEPEYAGCSKTVRQRKEKARRKAQNAGDEH